MKLASYHLLSDPASAPPRIGVVTNHGLVDVSDIVQALPDLPHAPYVTRHGMLRLLAGGPTALALVRAAAQQAAPDAVQPMAQVRLLAPVPRPGKIVAVGRNYADHAKESGDAPPELPRIISKMPSSVVGPGDAVTIPAGIAKLDYEIELAVVMSGFAHNVAPGEALNFVAGYTVLNDLSAREFQFDVSPPQSTFSKSMDGFCPLGPWIVTTDEIPDPQSLRLRCWLNDQLMQDGNTHEMIHGVRTIVSYASRFLTLEPGDVIATGTPAGVGFGRTPPVWLQPGDRMRLEIERIGVLEHTLQAATTRGAACSRA